MAKLRILLVDDHAVVREGMKSLVLAQPDLEVVGESDNGRDALEKARMLRPDIVVMDMSMPELNGALATQQIKHAWPQIKVLALTVHEEPGYLQQFLEAGASGYVLKRAAADELIRAIRAVAAGGLYLDPNVAEKAMHGLFHPRASQSDVSPKKLTNREAEVLRLMARGYSFKEIAAKLDLSVKTLATYKTRFMDKLGLQTRAEIVRYALGHGWLDQDEAP